LRRTGHNRRIVAEPAVAVELLKIGENALDVVQRMRALGMPCQLHPPPGWMGAGPNFGPAVQIYFRIHSSHLTSVRRSPITGAAQCAQLCPTAPNEGSESDATGAGRLVFARRQTETQTVRGDAL